MTAENIPDGEVFHPYLPVMPDDGQMYFSYDYTAQVQASLEGLEPEEEARRRAEIVLSAPTENEEWKAYRLKIGYASVAYRDVMWDVVKRARQVPDVNEAMLAILKEHDLSERIDEYAAGVIIAHCAADTENRQAALETANWAATLLSPESSHHRQVEGISRYVTREQEMPHHTDEELLALYAARTALGAGQTAEERAAIIQDRKRQEEEERQARIDRMEFLRKQPLKAFDEITESLHIRTAEQVLDLEFSELQELVEVAERIEERRKTLAAEEGGERASGLATGILEALTHRVQQLSPETCVRGMIDHTLFKRECDQVKEALTEADFWVALRELQQGWNGTRHKVHTADLYKQWREDYIYRREYEVANETLESFGIHSPEELISEHIDSVELSVQRGQVEYDNFEDMISDMRRYFLLEPTRKGLGKTAALDRVMQSSGGSITTLSLMNMINPGGDRQLMDDLENAMRQWYRTGGELFTDPAERGGGDPYKYTGGMFTGHGISVQRLGDTLALRMEGRGHCYNGNWPTEYIDAFAAYVDKEVAYEGNARITFVGAPSTDTRLEEQDIVYKRGRVVRKEVVPGQLHLGEIIDKLALLSGISPDLKNAIANIVITNPDYDQRTASAKGMHVTIDTGHLPDNPTFDSGVISGYQHVVKKEKDAHEESYFFLPSITFDLVHDDVSFQRVMNGFVHALGAKLRREHNGWRRYEHGRRQPYNSFAPYAWGAERYDS